MKKIPRIIGEYNNGNKGPLLFITAGIHGNEPGGLYALENIFEKLHRHQPSIKGKIIGIAGNRKALQKEKRFIDEDLNRTWTKENIKSGKKDSHEKIEMFDIIEVLKNQKDSFTKQFFLDCHTTSANSKPYISVQNVNDNDDWAHLFPTYIIRGFSDIVEGCIDHYESRIGHTGFVFEGGQHESKQSIKNHEGMVWLFIQKACGLDFNDLDIKPPTVKMLEAKQTDRKTFEVIYRHGLKDSDNFKMEPGFQNFQPLEKGELLATHNENSIYSKWNDYIFMPLYQAQGNDGFFIVKEVS